MKIVRVFDKRFCVPKEIVIGGRDSIQAVSIGGSAPVSIQTMWKEPIIGVGTQGDTGRLDAICERIEELRMLGCDIIRFAVPDMASAESFIEICRHSRMPLVADIHFDYKLAIKCLEGSVAAVRINPGNIGSRERVEAVVNACKDKGAAIRIGVNSGSLPKDLSEQAAKGLITRGEALSAAASRECEVFEQMNFTNYVVSMKATSVGETIEANEKFAAKYPVPLHIGVTEAGPLISGIVKSTLAFSRLLCEGVGSTIRVSLSSSPENEVIAGLEILRECGLRQGGVTLVSCPRCGRLGFDVHGFMARWQNKLLSMKKDITVAVMGCVVNGPGEAKQADIGIAGAGGKAIIFKKGQIVRTIDEKYADDIFEEELKSL